MLIDLAILPLKRRFVAVYSERRVRGADEQCMTDPEYIDSSEDVAISEAMSVAESGQGK